MTDTVGEVGTDLVAREDDLTAAALTHDGNDAPKRGSIAWVQAQGTVERDGRQVPACNRIPADATLDPSTTSCMVVFNDGTRCRGTAVRKLGLCMGHAGGGGMADQKSMSRKGAAKQHSLRLSRELLGIGASRTGDPRMVARLRAAQRAQDIAAAIVDGPLDAELKPLDKQRAALAALDATFPLQTASLTLSIDDPDDMSWNDMQQLAASLLG